MIQVIGVPADSVRDALAEVPLRLLPLSERAVAALAAAKAGYFAYTIPRGAYANQKQDVRTVATAALLLAGADLSDDRGRHDHALRVRERPRFRGARQRPGRAGFRGERAPGPLDSAAHRGRQSARGADRQVAGWSRRPPQSVTPTDSTPGCSSATCVITSRASAARLRSASSGATAAGPIPTSPCRRSAPRLYPSASSQRTRAASAIGLARPNSLGYGRDSRTKGELPGRRPDPGRGAGRAAAARRHASTHGVSSLWGRAPAPGVLPLRVQDVDFGTNQIVVRSGKGDKDRVTMLPAVVKPHLARHLERVHEQHRGDLKAGAGWVELPTALAREYPNAGREWLLQWVFPATRTYVDRLTGEHRRHHLHESVLQRAVKQAVWRAGSPSGPAPTRSPLVRHPPARGRPRHPDRPGTSGAPRRVDDADLHARPEPWPVWRAQPAGRDAGCVISPPFRPGYPTRYTAAPCGIAQPGAAGEEPVSRQNYWTAGTRTGRRARCYTPPRCCFWGATLVGVFMDRIVVRRTDTEKLGRWA